MAVAHVLSVPAGTIDEVTSFTRRLTSAHKRQITKSLTRAVDVHDPSSWVLVIPLDPSPAEVTWFDTLTAEFPDVALEWFGLDWLDGKVAGRESLISYVEGANYTLLRRAQQRGAEREALATGDDFLGRMVDLQELGNTITPYWRWEVGDSPWGPVSTFTAQREDAPTEDPVELTPRFQFPDDDPEAAEAQERLRRFFRLGGDVEIPGRFVEEVRLTAASEATRRLLGAASRQVSQLRLISIPDNTGLPLRGTLALERPGVTDTVSVPFAFTQRVGGHGGSTLTGADDSGLVEATLELVEEDEDTVTGALTHTHVVEGYHQGVVALAELAAWYGQVPAELAEELGPPRFSFAEVGAGQQEADDDLDDCDAPLFPPGWSTRTPAAG